jgi:hypothetical protein
MRLDDYGSWSIYDEIRANRSDYDMNNSAEWFMKNVRGASNVPGLGPMRMLGDHLERQSKTIELGSMYMYTYYPIHYDTLPMYDKFPLCIPFSKEGKYFTGLNLHYLHPKTRLVLLDRLLALSTHKTLNERAKLSLTWRLLSSAAKFPEVAPCVKKYHIGHVKSMFLKVPPKDWVMAIFLPLERFEKKNNNQVWAISKKKIGK